nr:PREDICTED: gephyrin-like [Linepithema humile]XP_012233017.1 PREDICTED: gephyrin-like [Linepithema humile]
MASDLQQKTEMDTDTKIIIISVCMDETTQLYNALRQMLQQTFDETKVHDSIHCINTQNIEELKEKLIFYTDSNPTDIILVLSAHSLKDSINEAIDEVNDTETAIVKFFATIPILLESSISESLNYAYHKNTLIFFAFGNESDITNIVKKTKDSMVLAAYLLRNIHPNCNKSNHPYEGKNQIISSSCSDQFSAPKGEEKEEMSTLPTSTFDKNIQTEDEMSCSISEQSSSQKEDEEINMSTSSYSSSPKNSQMGKHDINASTSQITCPPIISVDEALTTMLYGIIENVDESVLTETVDIKDAFDRQLLDSVICHSNVPSFSVATKRGYAVVVEKIRKMEGISDESSKINSIILDPVTTKWVNSGEFIPSEATAVIPEDNVAISYDDKGNEIKTTSHSIIDRQNIKLPGSDIKKEEVIVRSNVRMGSMEIGLLTACGWKQVDVIKEKSIGVLTIEHKLQKHREPLQPKYDSNRAFLISNLLKENGFNSSDFGIFPKNSAIIIQNITAALETADLLVIIRCSKDKDLLNRILEHEFKATLYFENVNIKPGRSTTFASCSFDCKMKYILCLPSKPESVLVTAHLFLLPLIKMLHSNTDEKFTKVLAKITRELPLHLHSRPRYVWATLLWSKKKKYAEIYCRNNVTSDKLSKIINTNALLILPAKKPGVDTLADPIFVPAILIKLPTIYK